MRVLIVYPILAREIPLMEQRLRLSLENIKTIKTMEVFHLFIVQDEPYIIPPDWKMSNSDIIFLEDKAVSFARNAGLDYAENGKFDYLLYHESSIIFSDGFCTFIDSASRETRDLIYTGRVVWTLPESSPLILGTEEEKPNILKNSCVCCYLLPVKLIRGLRFTTKVGPGKITAIKAGEDTNFLVDFFKQNKSYKIIHSQNAILYHPPRPTDGSKHLFYSRGQGAMYRHFLSEKTLGYGVLTYFFLFWGNTILRVLLFRKNARKIFMERARGFFSKDYLLFRADSK